MIKLHKRPNMTLLEVLIAMTLLSFLLLFIFSFFRDLSKIDQWAHVQQFNTFQMRYGEYRLGYIFSKLINEGDRAKKGTIFRCDSSQKTEGFSKFPSLIFKYNNGPRLDPDFSGDLLGRLYLNEDKQLCLASWPLFSQQPQASMRKEILMENIESLKFEFFKTPLQSQAEPSAISGWQDEWSDQSKFPGLIKVHVSILEKKDPTQRLQSEKELIKQVTFVFPLPKQAEEAIHYKSTGES
jgi:type II secretory pathway pseudopilin PulG